MFGKIANILRNTFVTSDKTELEEFLEGRNLETQADVEFWMQEYDNRRRLASKMMSKGEYLAARQIMRA